MIYLDHAATTPVPRAVADTMYTVLTEHFGNPSAQYPMGLETKKQVELWRRTVAKALGSESPFRAFTPDTYAAGCMRPVWSMLYSPESRSWEMGTMV